MKLGWNKLQMKLFKNEFKLETNQILQFSASGQTQIFGQMSSLHDSFIALWVVFHLLWILGLKCVAELHVLTEWYGVTQLDICIFLSVGWVQVDSIRVSDRPPGNSSIAVPSQQHLDLKLLHQLWLTAISKCMSECVFGIYCPDMSSIASWLLEDHRCQIYL